MRNQKGFFYLNFKKEDAKENNSHKNKVNDLRKPLNLEDEKINEVVKIYNRKRWIWLISIWSIIIIALSILAVIATTIIEIRSIIISSNINAPSDIDTLTKAIKNIGYMWHIYLISLVSLTSLMSFFIYINRQTWIEEKKDKNIDNGHNLTDAMPLLNNIIDLIKSQTSKISEKPD